MSKPKRREVGIDPTLDDAGPTAPEGEAPLDSSVDEIAMRLAQIHAHRVGTEEDLINTLSPCLSVVNSDLLEILTMIGVPLRRSLAEEATTPDSAEAQLQALNVYLQTSKQVLQYSHLETMLAQRPRPAEDPPKGIRRLPR